MILITIKQQRYCFCTHFTDEEVEAHSHSHTPNECKTRSWSQTSLLQIQHVSINHLVEIHLKGQRKEWPGQDRSREDAAGSWWVTADSGGWKGRGADVKGHDRWQRTQPRPPSAWRTWPKIQAFPQHNRSPSGGRSRRDLLPHPPPPPPPPPSAPPLPSHSSASCSPASSFRSGPSVKCQCGSKPRVKVSLLCPLVMCHL